LRPTIYDKLCYILRAVKDGYYLRYGSKSLPSLRIAGASVLLDAVPQRLERFDKLLGLLGILAYVQESLTTQAV
jgi:hypothetical protein